MFKEVAEESDAVGIAKFKLKSANGEEFELLDATLFNVYAPTGEYFWFISFLVFILL